MKLYNLKHPDEVASFKQAVLQSLGRDNGLFFPLQIPKLSDIDKLLDQPFVERSSLILQHLLGEELGNELVDQLVRSAFSFPVPVVPVDERISTLELFHGPTLAFKDFGARFMARVMSHLIERGDHTGPLTILTATSGDTGAAVAHAFYGLPDIQVVVLYPNNRISPLQEKLFCTLGGNIHTIAVEDDFDSCQSLAKTCFTDGDFVLRYGLNSANSINVARLIAQVTYYFEAAAQSHGKAPVVSVPSGNFGNLTAGLIAQSLGAPIKAFVAGTNANDTVPRYLHSGTWEAHDTIATLSNAMDVSSPNNWPRIEELFATSLRSLRAELRSCTVSEAETSAAIKALYDRGYLSEPHGAVAYASLVKNLEDTETGIFLGTSDPAKFRQAVEQILGIQVELPEELKAVEGKPVLSTTLSPDVVTLKALIEKLWQ